MQSIKGSRGKLHRLPSASYVFIFRTVLLIKRTSCLKIMAGFRVGKKKEMRKNRQMRTRQEDGLMKTIYRSGAALIAPTKFCFIFLMLQKVI